MNGTSLKMLGLEMCHKEQTLLLYRLGHTGANCKAATAVAAGGSHGTTATLQSTAATQEQTINRCSLGSLSAQPRDFIVPLSITLSVSSLENAHCCCQCGSTVLLLYSTACLHVCTAASHSSPFPTQSIEDRVALLLRKTDREEEGFHLLWVRVREKCRY